MAPKGQFPVDNVIDGIRAPIERVVTATPRTTAATPLVGKQDLSPFIVEGCRVPVGKPFVRDDIDPLRLPGIRYIENNAVSRASACGDIRLGKHSDVMTLVCFRGFLRAITMITSLPQSRQTTRFRIGKHRRAVNDFGF